MSVKIDLLIATRNRPELLEKCLSSIKGNRLKPNTTFILDQSDNSETKSLSDKFSSELNLEYKHLETPGKSLSLNAGINSSDADFIALTDDDTTMPPDWFETALKLIEEQSEVDAFCGRVLETPGTNPDEYLNLVLDEQARDISPNANPLAYGFCGADLLIRRASIVKAGGFNPLFGPGGRFYCNIDGELAYRLLKTGAKLRYVPDIFVYHAPWRGDEDNERLNYRYAFGLGAFAGHYFRKTRLAPFYYFFRKSVAKSLKILISQCLGNSQKRNHEFLFLKGFVNGFGDGLRTKPLEVEIK